MEAAANLQTVTDAIWSSMTTFVESLGDDAMPIFDAMADWIIDALNNTADDVPELAALLLNGQDIDPDDIDGQWLFDRLTWTATTSRILSRPAPT